MIQNFKNLEIVLHLTCLNHNSSQIDLLLNKAKELNIRNLFILRGDKISTDLQTNQQFNYANELISYIRETDFDSTICAAGYPGKFSKKFDQ